jgi:hypothetical protein
MLTGYSHLIRHVAASLVLVLGVAVASRSALAYRPFDGTDAAVAPAGELEVEAPYGHSPAGGALADIGRRGAQSNAKSAVQAFVGQVAFELLRQKHDDARTKSRRIGFAAEAHTVVGYR